VPASGWVSFVVPYLFTASVIQTCFVKPTNEFEQVAQSCILQSPSVFVQLFADFGSVYGKFEAGISSYIRVTSLISPIYSGFYIFDFSTYDSGLNMIETGTATGSLTASIMNPTFNVIHAGLSTPTIIQAQFTLSKNLPLSSLSSARKI
jgi:hypothetical protein